MLCRILKVILMITRDSSGRVVARRRAAAARALRFVAAMRTVNTQYRTHCTHHTVFYAHMCVDRPPWLQPWQIFVFNSKTLRTSRLYKSIRGTIQSFGAWLHELHVGSAECTVSNACGMLITRFLVNNVSKGPHSITSHARRIIPSIYYKISDKPLILADEAVRAICITVMPYLSNPSR